MQPLLNFLSIELTVLLTAALPIIELRGAIPVGISLGLSPIHSTLISLVGSMIPVPFILFSIASESSKACPHKEPRVEENGKLRLSRNISNHK
ncbi:small multi-drug export protein [Clostridium algidicarnis]|uniref:small multi-drug export protein n=1 Tax=Clostridium algidicarnis TaxID=37659 RepID=UPI001C0BD86F|nr:small multi-drug export protein [Clostridium algidicarnis]MBU3194431.1 small multi-drug export protein [Clostridium algidicarnis]